MRQIRHLELLMLMMLLAGAVRLFPLQHHISLSRYQHWAIALYVWGIGFFIQAAWSWKRLSKIGKASLVAAGVYVLSSAAALYSNPWLDSSISLQFAEQESTRFVISLSCCAGGLLVGLLWIRWGLSEIDRLDRKERVE